MSSEIVLKMTSKVVFAIKKDKELSLYVSCFLFISSIRSAKERVCLGPLISGQVGESVLVNNEYIIE